MKPLDTSVEFGINQSPQEYKKALEVSKSLNVPFNFVRDNQKESEAIARKRDLLQKIKESNELKKSFSNPDFAALAHNDAENLVNIEKTLKPGIGSIAKGMAWALPEATELTYQGIRMQWADLIGSDRIRKDAERMIKGVHEHIALKTPKFESATAKGLYSGATSLMRQIPGLAASIMTRSPTPALITAGATVEAEAYGKYRIRGATPLQSLTGAMGEGLTEVATELMPMGFLVNKFGKVGFGDFLTGLMAREIPGEQVATIVQDAIDTAIENPDKTWGEYIQERPDAAYQTLLATVVQSGILGGASTIASRFATDTEKAQMAVNKSERFKKEIESVLKSELRTTAPEEFKQVIDKFIDEDQNIFLAAEDAQALFQNDREFQESLPDHLAQESDMVISKAEYLTYFSDKHEQLSEVIRNDEDGMNVQESNEWSDQIGQEQFEEEATSALVEQEFQVRSEVSADKVAKNIEEQIVKTQRVTKDVAKRYAALHKAFAQSMAEKLGISPEEVYKQFGLGVTGEAIVGEGLSQAIETPEFKQWFGESQVVDDSGDPLVVYHGTREDIKKFDVGFLGSGSKHPTSKLGFFFAETGAEASKYAEEGKTGNVMPVYISIKSPHEMSSSEFQELLEPGKPKPEEIIQGLHDSFEGSGYYIEELYDINIIDEVSFMEEVSGDEPNKVNIDDLPEELQKHVFAAMDEAEKHENYDARDAFGDKDLMKKMEEMKKELISKGHDGIIIKPDGLSTFAELDYTNYVVFEPNKIKSKFNIGAFDPKDPRILYQKERAQIQFQDSGALITLLENADLSSFLHESGHLFFESYRHFANQNEDIANDMKALLDFVGVESLETWDGMTLDQRREGHEKVARAFESYLFEGKAPSIELQGAFQRFRDWLVNVYKNLVSLNVKLTPEVRQIFDRMLATDQQIQEAKVSRSYIPMFTSQEDMTDNQWKAYQKLDDERNDLARNEHQTRSLKDMQWLENAKSKELKRLQRENKAKRLEIKIQVIEDVKKESVYFAMDFLRQNKMDINAVREMYGDKIKRSRPDIVDHKIDNLLVAIAKLGGLTKEEAESKGIDPETWKGKNALRKLNQPIIGKRVFKKEGLTFDEMSEALREYDYNISDHNVLLDKIQDSLAGNEVHSTQYEPDISEFEEVPEVNWHKLGSGKTGMMQFDGFHPDVAAQMIGFTSGDNMIRSILDAVPIKERIEMLTDQRTLEKHGDITSIEAMKSAADEALHNKAHARFLHSELNHLSRLTGSRNVLAKTAREYAQKIIRRKKAREIRPNQFLSAHVRAGVNAEKALKKGDLDSAAEHKRAQIINFHIYKEALKAKEAIDKTYKYLNKFNKRKPIKTIEQDALEQIYSLLEAYEFKKVSLKELDKREAYQVWVERQKEMGFDVIADESLFNQKKNYKNMTIEELNGLKDSIKNIEHLGRQKQKLLDERRKESFNETIQSARVSIEGNANRVVKERATPTDVLGHMGQFARNVAAMHRKFSSIVREMDGNTYGYMSHLLLRGMGDAGSNETEANAVDAKAMAELFDPVLGGIRKGGLPLNIKAKKIQIPGTNISLNREQILMFGMNWGNEGNRQRLMDGGITGKKALTQSEAQAILNQINEREWHFIQGVLDYISTKKTAIAAQEKRLTGVEPKWIDPTPIETKYGTFPGGYFPAKYDSLQSTRSTVLEAATDLRQAMKGVFQSPSARGSYGKERAEKVVGRPILLNFNSISMHLSEVNHRLHWQDWLTDTSRILKALDGDIRQYYGTEMLGELRDTVTDIASGDAQSTNWLVKSINHLRVGSTVIGLGWRFTTALMQPSGLAQSWVRVGSKHMMKGMHKYLKNPIKAGRESDEKSKFMKYRALTMQREVNEVMNNIRAGDKMGLIKASSFLMIQKMQRTVDIPTFWGAYEKALSDLHVETAVDKKQRDEIDAQAVSIADQTVRDSQASGLIGDLAKVQRGHPMWKIFTNFYSYFSATYNLNVEAVRATKFKNPSSVAALAVDLAVLNTIPVLFVVALKELLKNECHGELECIGEKIATDQLNYVLGLSIPTRELTSGVQAALGLEHFGYEGPAGIRPLVEFGKLGVQLGQGEADMALFKALTKTAGALLHLPAGQMNATLEGILAVENGEVEGFGALTAVLVGPPRK